MPAKRRIAIALDLDEPFPHHQEIFAGTQRYAKQHPEWECLIDEHPGYQLRSRTAQAKQYDGVIARAPKDLVQRLRRRGIPFVNVWYQTESPGVPGVYSDAGLLGQMAADHLLQRGFRRLSYQDVEGHRHTRQTGVAFAQRAEATGHDCLMHEIPEGSFNDPRYWLALERRLADWVEQLEPPVGVFIEDPPVARLLIAMCRHRGWHVPQDVAILCKYYVQAVVELPTPQLSYMNLNDERAGYEAAAMLDHMMNGGPPPEQPIYIPPRGVFARESTDYFAVEDELVAQALRYVSTRLGERLSVAQIAAAVLVSPRLLQMRFDKALGRSISQEIRRLRLESAKRMLVEKDRRISEIAEQAGFVNAIRMNEVFRRELGTTPGAYRRQVLGED
jgi:LacI family transcriptional regulator